jgi:predicted nucleotidyltransferase
MTRTAVLNALRDCAADIRAAGVTGLHLYGSAARGELRDGSNVNLFIDYDPAKFSFAEMIRLRDRLSSVLGKPVDLTTRDGLDPELRAQIDAEVVKVF